MKQFNPLRKKGYWIGTLNPNKLKDAYFIVGYGVASHFDTRLRLVNVFYEFYD